MVCQDVDMKVPVQTVFRKVGSFPDMPVGCALSPRHSRGHPSPQLLQTEGNVHAASRRDWQRPCVGSVPFTPHLPLGVRANLCRQRVSPTPRCGGRLPVARTHQVKFFPVW